MTKQHREELQLTNKVLRDRLAAVEAREAEQCLLLKGSIQKGGELLGKVKELEGKLSICRAALDHPVQCPKCETHFLPYIDPNELRGVTPAELRTALHP